MGRKRLRSLSHREKEILRGSALLWRMSLTVYEHDIFGAKIFHAEPRHLFGVIGLPPDFAALYGNRLLIVGKPHHDVKQAAIAAAGFTRLDVSMHPRGERPTGLLVNLVA